MKITEEYYLIKCEVCEKKKKVKEDPCSETFLCKQCKDDLQEPNKENIEFPEYIFELEDWCYKTGKTSDYNYDNFKKDLFEYHNVKGEKANLAYNIAWENEHSNGLYQVCQEFEKLVELIK